MNEELKKKIQKELLDPIKDPRRVMKMEYLFSHKYILIAVIIAVDLFLIMAFSFLFHMVGMIPRILGGREIQLFALRNFLPDFTKMPIQGGLAALLIIFIADAYLIYRIRVSWADKGFNVGQEGTDRFTTAEEIQEQYKDRLTIISLSSDTQNRWKAASAQHEMTWQNLSDLKQTAGLYAVYDVNGIPNYVLISPEGKIVKMWSGYGQGSLKLKMRRYLDAPKREMSITGDTNRKVVNHPSFESTNTDILEVKQVELTDTATIVHFYAYYIPKYWIQVSANAQLVDEQGVSYTLQKADGITPGEHFFLPESGEAEFSLTFKPLPLKTKLFNFTEGTAKKDWQINGIKLTK